MTRSTETRYALVEDCRAAFSAEHRGQRSAPSSVVDHPGGATSFTSYSTSCAPQAQLNSATLHGKGAGMTK